MKEKKILLVGNPNVGKSAIFKSLTGKHVDISNYPGTTVTVVKGRTKIGEKRYIFVDTPGMNSLFPNTEEEQVTREILMKEDYEGVLLIGDAKNIKRTLNLLFQVSEMNVPIILILNMWDEAKGIGMEINLQGLEQELGIKVIPTIAIQSWNIREVKKNLNNFNRMKKLNSLLSMSLEENIKKIEDALPEIYKKRIYAILFLSEEKEFENLLKNNIDERSFNIITELRKNARKRFREPFPYIFILENYRKTDELIKKYVQIPKKIMYPKFFNFLDAFTIHPFFGVFFLIFVLTIFFLFVGYIGAGILVGFFEEFLFGKFINPFFILLLGNIPFLGEFLVGEYGIITMALTYGIGIILPVVFTFFIAFSILEDSGYLPRLASLIDRIFKLIGLTGKAVLPMVLGFGCDTMATLTTRILETKRERVIVTFLLALGIPCSAQIGVILTLFTGISPLVFILWSIIIAFNVLFAGYLSSKVIKGKTPPFILEIPPLRTPYLRNILWKTTKRVEWYLKEIIPLFIIGTIVLFIFDKIGLLPFLVQSTGPFVKSFLGLPEQSVTAFIMGFLRRDYGAAGLFHLKENGFLSPLQILISSVVITLFVPCIANFLIIGKERGWITAITIFFLNIFYAFLFGAFLFRIFHSLKIQL